MKMQHRYTEPRPTAVLDTECYPGYWSIAFRDVQRPEKRKVFELYQGHPLDRAGIAKVLRNWRVVSFNGRNYDAPMIALAMRGATTEELKRASDEIIVTGLKFWDFYERYDVSMPPFFDHIDLIEVAPSAPRRVSLKMYAAMLHSKRMQDLPFEPSTFIDDEKRPVLQSYHFNDLDVTADLYWELKTQLDIRAHASDEYGVDLRSKSDAQMGEAVLKAVIEKKIGRKIYRPDIQSGVLHFECPAFIRFETPEFQRMLNDVCRANFRICADGQLLPPPELEKRVVTLGAMQYTMGIGGLHSKEQSISHFADDDVQIEDNDVRGYYPKQMIASGREPANLKGLFQPIFREKVAWRDTVKAMIGPAEAKIKEIEAKLAADPENVILQGWAKDAKKKLTDVQAEAETWKIFSNGIFGKTNQPFSIVSSPAMFIQTTVGGQLSLLMLIERVFLAGFTVISANTDGFVTKIPRSRYWFFRSLIWEWEEDTQLETEKTAYRSVHSRDVNNYVAITTDGKAKRKGSYRQSGRGQKAAEGLKKNPDVEICSDAVVAYLKDGTPIEKTVYECQDIRKFVTARVVKGGALKNGELIGKTIRWFYCDDSPEPLTYQTNGNKVPDSDWACPCLELPDEFPRNVNHAWYIREANAILNDIGMKGVDPALVGRKGVVLARQADQKTIHSVDLTTGIGLCGAVRASIRDAWIEFDALPDGHRHCKKCRDLEL